VSRNGSRLQPTRRFDVAGYVAAHLAELARVSDDAKDRDSKLRTFCRLFAERAFRRPLTDAEKKQLVDRQFEGGADLNQAVKRVVIRVMMSPEFLYPGVQRRPRWIRSGISLGAGAMGFTSG